MSFSFGISPRLREKSVWHTFCKHLIEWSGVLDNRHVKQTKSCTAVTYCCYYFFFLPAWIGGFISISIISFLSLLGVILVPLMNRVFFKFLLSFLVALAVGTLSGDAFLHLLPHVSINYCFIHYLKAENLTAVCISDKFNPS